MVVKCLSECVCVCVRSFSQTSKGLRRYFKIVSLNVGNHLLRGVGNGAHGFVPLNVGGPNQARLDLTNVVMSGGGKIVR